MTCFLFFASAPSAPPTDVTVIIESDEITVQWEPPNFNDRNGIIRRYNVFIIENSTGASTNISEFSNDRAITFSNLKPFTSYHIKVAAYTVAIGPFSPILVVLTLAAG